MAFLLYLNESELAVYPDFPVELKACRFSPIFYLFFADCGFLKKNQNAPRPSENPPVMGEKCQNV